MAEEEVVEALPPVRRRWQVIRALTLGAFGVVVAIQAVSAALAPSIATMVTAGAFALLFAAVMVQVVVVRALRQRRWHGMVTRLHGSAYLSDLGNLPNRNYLLSELRREMPRARAVGAPFVLIVLSLDDLDGVGERRGEDFAARARQGLADVLKRFTRTSDFVAHLGGASFCVMLAECSYKDSFIYLQRVPGSIAVSDGHRMYEVPVSARLYEYDLEALYATDVLREAEGARTLRRKDEPRFGSEAA